MEFGEFCTFLLMPEEGEKKHADVFGKTWARFRENLGMFFLNLYKK